MIALFLGSIGSMAQIRQKKWRKINEQAFYANPCNPLQNYPMDIQRCSIIIESFKYNSDQVKIGWLEHPVSFGPSALASEGFTLIGTYIKDGSHNYTYYTWTFPRQYLHFILQRKLGYFYVQVRENIISSFGHFFPLTRNDQNFVHCRLPSHILQDRYTKMLTLFLWDIAITM